MNIDPHVSITLAAKVTPQEDSAYGVFNIGTALQNIAIPDDADQMLVIKFVLDEAGSEVDKPSALYLEPATGQAEVDLAAVPAGWTASEFATWALAEKFGTATPALDADGVAMDLTEAYAISITAENPVTLESLANSGNAWTGMLDGSLSARNFLAEDINGLPVVADDQLKITNDYAGENTITIVMLGKQ